MDILEVKNIIPEIRNLLEMFKNRLDTTEASISELEIRDEENSLHWLLAGEILSLKFYLGYCQNILY